MPSSSFRQASGFVPGPTGNVLVDVLSRCGTDRWFYRPERVASPSGTVLAPSRLAMTGSGLELEDPNARPVPISYSDTGMSLRDLVGRWETEGFSGRAWQVDGLVGLAAPAYSDSLIISGGESCVRPLAEELSLEAYAVARRHPLPALVS